MGFSKNLQNPLAMGVFLFTLLLPVLVGMLTLKRMRSQADFLVGGRRMGRFAVALSAVSSGRSSWLILGVSGLAYTKGVSAIWAVVGYILVELFQFLFIGVRLRRECGRQNSLTLVDYFASRFGNDLRLRWVGALVMAVFLTAYVSAQFNAAAKSLAEAVQIDTFWALLLSAVLTLAYMLMGGFVAVVYNDMVRAFLMLFALLIFPLVGLFSIGGLDALLLDLKNVDASLVDPCALSFGTMIGYVGIGLGSPGQPHIVTRYISINDEDGLRLAAVIGTIWNVLLAWGAIFIGLIGRGLFSQVESLPQGDPERVYLVLAGHFFGPVLYGLMVGGVFAAILSTADSQLLVVASNVVRDIYECVFCHGKELSEKRRLLLSRLVVLIAGTFAVFAAWYAEDLVFWLVLFAWGGLGAAFGPALIFSLWWSRTAATGVLAGFLVGPAVVIVWKLWLKETTGLYELIPGFLLSSLAVIIFSLVSSKNERNIATF